jgi:hypothetical protein
MGLWLKTNGTYLLSTVIQCLQPMPTFWNIIRLLNCLAFQSFDWAYYRNVPDDGYYRNVPDDGYYRNQSFDVERTWWWLFQKPIFLNVKRLVSGITIIRYAQSQKIGFCNNHHQVLSKSKDWFLE